MNARSRREFLADVSRGMLIAGLGSTLAADLGLTSAHAAEGPDGHITFGPLEPLVGLMQETPPDKLLPLLVDRLNSGTELKQLVAAGALANARSFGGEDYVGFHTMMAMAPAWHMSGEMPADKKALPVLKVLYRNTKRIQEVGGKAAEALKPVEPSDPPKGRPADTIREAVIRKDKEAAERTFAAVCQSGADEAFNQLLDVVEDCLDVHRVVLPWRAWALLDIVGKEQAHTMLRQSVRYCVKNENPGYRKQCAPARELVTKLFDQHKFAGGKLGNRSADDAWIDKFTDTIFTSSPAQAAEAAAGALAEGFAPEVIGEAIALAANQLVLRDAGRPQNQTSPGKPVGSVHGDSIGVHACDSANAWRNMAKVGNAQNQVACLILSAYQMARDRAERGGDFLNWKPRPWAEQLEAVKGKEPDALLKEAEAAIRENDQAKACAIVARYGQAGGAARAMFDLLLRYAVSEEGALHAEKYYRTVSEEFALTRPAFRWRQLVALARVTASEFGQPAAGYADACHLLKV
jgi:hypothetical protein